MLLANVDSKIKTVIFKRFKYEMTEMLFLCGSVNIVICI